jgi:hypothetical protein
MRPIIAQRASKQRGVLPHHAIASENAVTSYWRRSTLQAHAADAADAGGRC